MWVQLGFQPQFELFRDKTSSNVLCESHEMSDNTLPYFKVILVWRLPYAFLPLNLDQSNLALQ